MTTLKNKNKKMVRDPPRSLLTIQRELRKGKSSVSVQLGK